MKKIVTIICVISIIMTSAVFSVSAAEAKNIEKEVQTENTTVELEIVPESEPTETTPNADTVPIIKETDETKTVEPKPERIGDSSYEEMSWSVECDTSGQSVPWEALSPEEQAEHEQWLAEQEAKDKEKAKEYLEANPRPLIAVTFKSDMEKYITSEVYEKAEAMMVAEIASSEKLGIDEVPVYINAEGKVVSEKDLVLEKDFIIKLAAIYYEAFNLYQKETYGEAMYMFQDFVLRMCTYNEEAGVWLVDFCTDKEKYPEREGADIIVVIRDNGEFVGLG